MQNIGPLQAYKGSAGRRGDRSLETSLKSHGNSQAFEPRKLKTRHLLKPKETPFISISISDPIHNMVSSVWVILSNTYNALPTTNPYLPWVLQSVTLHTNLGDIKCEIFCDEVAKTAEVRTPFSFNYFPSFISFSVLWFYLSENNTSWSFCCRKLFMIKYTLWLEFRLKLVPIGVP